MGQLPRTPDIAALVDNLMACRVIAGQHPRIEEHIELLIDMLLAEPAPR